jgi:hypothetical protein
MVVEKLIARRLLMNEESQLKDYSGIISHYKKEYGKNVERNAKMHSTAEHILCGTNKRIRNVRI